MDWVQIDAGARPDKCLAAARSALGSMSAADKVER
jgi:hypothetical protein